MGVIGAHDALEEELHESVLGTNTKVARCVIIPTVLAGVLSEPTPHGLIAVDVMLAWVSSEPTRH